MENVSNSKEDDDRQEGGTILTLNHFHHFRHVPVTQGLIKLISMCKHCEKWGERERRRKRYGKRHMDKQGG